jgi:hypothetical protein
MTKFVPCCLCKVYTNKMCHLICILLDRKFHVMTDKMFIINLDYCIVFMMIDFILSSCKILYDSIDTIFVLKLIFTFCKAGHQEN